MIVCSDGDYLNELDGSGGCLLFALIIVALMTKKRKRTLNSGFRKLVLCIPGSHKLNSFIPISKEN